MMPRQQAGPARGWQVAAAIVALLTLVYFPLPAWTQILTKESEPLPGGTRPLEVVKASFSRVMAVQGTERRGEIHRVTEELFDFPEMARRMLGEHWQNGSVLQQEEFVRLFSDMLERMYLTNIASMPPAAVTFDGESVTGPYARVTSHIAGRRGDTWVEYRLLDKAGRWTVYDLAVEGVSLVSSYRSQFGSILQNSSFADLLARLGNRQASTRPEQGP